MRSWFSCDWKYILRSRNHHEWSVLSVHRFILKRSTVSSSTLGRLKYGVSALLLATVLDVA